MNSCFAFIANEIINCNQLPISREKAEMGQLWTIRHSAEEMRGMTN